MTDWRRRIEDAWLRLRDLDQRLKRTADLNEREELKKRRDPAQRELRSVVQEAKRAAENGDPGAQAIIDELETAVARIADEP